MNSVAEQRRQREVSVNLMMQISSNRKNREEKRLNNNNKMNRA